MSKLLQTNPTPESFAGKKVRFIAFEGIDGSGKSDLVSALATQFRSNSDFVYTLFEPGSTQVGTGVRSILKKASVDPRVAFLLLEGARVENLLMIQKVLARKDNAVVLTDRHADSSWAYQGAMGVSSDFINAVQSQHKDIIVPDVTIYLDVAVGIAESRLQLRDKVSEALDDDAMDFMSDIAERYEQRILSNRSAYFVVDANQTRTQVFSNTLDFLKKVM